MTAAERDADRQRHERRVERGHRSAVNLSGSDAETCELTFSTSPSRAWSLAPSSTTPAARTGPFTDTATVTYTPAKQLLRRRLVHLQGQRRGERLRRAATVTITVTGVNDKPDGRRGEHVHHDGHAQGHHPDRPRRRGLRPDVLGHRRTIGTVRWARSPNNACTAGRAEHRHGLDHLHRRPRGYTGGDSFTYKVTDGDPLDSTDATVTITVTGGSPTTITLYPVADSHVNSGSVNSNYGTLNPIRTREDATLANPTYRPYYQFNVPAFSGTVQSVKLRLFVTRPPARR